MRTISGLLLIIIALFGTIFFRRYNGSVIPYPGLWYLFFIVLGLLGVWILFSAAGRIKRIVSQHMNSEIEKLKLNAEKIELNFDKCEFKNGSFSHLVEDPTMSTVKLFAPGSLTSIDTTVTENVIQSYLIYTDTINGENCKFISQSFPFDETTLKFYVLNQNITLYVDRYDKKKYLFDFKR